MNKKEIIIKSKNSITNLKEFITSRVLSEKNLTRDSLVIAAVVIVVASIIGISKYNFFKEEQLFRKADALVKNHVEDEFQKESRDKINSIQSQVDTSEWRDYESKWYGFKIKYPQDWKKPIAGISVGNSGAEYRYGFRKANDSEGKYIGFDVVVYNISKTKEFTNTGEFPALKNGLVEEEHDCETIEGHLIETGDYSAEEIYIPLEDDCYESVLFFSVTQGQYIYNIVPVLRDGLEETGDRMVEISDNLPEFFSAISFFDNIEIVRPKPKPRAVINAPKPVSYKKDSLGRRVCAKKNDKPGKSKKDKGKHLDMECCLDPDEYPNPHCYYSPDKYGKYLK